MIAKRRSVRVDKWSILPREGQIEVFEEVYPHRWRTIRVVEKPGYVFKCRKGVLYADGGVDGLMRWIERCLKEDLMVCRVKQICEYVITQS